MTSILKVYSITINYYLSVLIGIIAFGCSDEPLNTAPKAKLEIFPFAGDTTTIFTFDASNSSDNEDIKEKLSVRWDWNDDGIWDTSFQSELKALFRFTTKGMKYIKMELSDSRGSTVILTDSVRVFAIPIIGTMVDPRDGELYQTVFLEGTWWMAESIRYGLVVPFDSLQKNNGIVEAYTYNNDLKNFNEYGGMYSWFEAMQYNDTEKAQGICPPGWHIPSFDEWSTIAPFNLPYLFLYYYYGPGGPGGLNLKYGGSYTFIWETRGGEKYERYFGDINLRAEFWTSTNKKEKYEDFAGNIAFQRWNISIGIENVLNDSLPDTFDNFGLILGGDEIHLSGKIVAYDRFGSSHPTNSRYAHYVRCTQNQ